MDSTITIAELKQKVQQFVHERDWQQFHSPKNLSMLIATEAAELMEPFRWSRTSEESLRDLEQNRQNVEDELADITIGILMFCAAHNIDLSNAIENKMALGAQRYPLEKAKGVTRKYNQL